MKLDTDDLIMVSQILERDSKNTTYKFALLRATIDVIQLFDHLIYRDNETSKVVVPTGLIVERWIWYYYPLLVDGFFPQKHNEPLEIVPRKNIAFRKSFTDLIRMWQPRYGGFWHLYNDFKKKVLPPEINAQLKDLVIRLYDTITRMPMRHIGHYGSGEDYSIYRIHSGKEKILPVDVITTELLVRKMGTFTFPYKFYLTLKYLGSFIEGMDSVLNKWAEFITVANKRYSVDKEIVLDRLSQVPESFRDVGEVKKYYHEVMKRKRLYCVWSGNRLREEDLNVDHVLPFSRFPNNSFWNLLPAKRSVNNKKRDRIPEPEFLQKRSGIIFDYWNMLWDHYENEFLEEVRMDLLPVQQRSGFWQDTAFKSLQGKASDLIHIRGMESWSL